MGKKIILIILIIAAVIVGVLYYRTNLTEQSGTTQVVESKISTTSASETLKDENGQDTGSISAVSQDSLSLVKSDGGKRTYTIGSDTTFFKTTDIALLDLLKGEALVVAVQPSVGGVFSLTAFKDQADVPVIGDDQKFVFSGLVDSVASTSLKIKDSKGAFKTFDIISSTKITRTEKIDISSIKMGDRAQVSWYTSARVLKAAGIFIVSK